MIKTTLHGMTDKLLALAFVALLAVSCATNSAYALNLTPEQIKVMTPEQLQAVIQLQQQQLAAAPAVQAPAPVQPQAPAPVAAEKPAEEGMDAMTAGLLGAAGGALAGGLIGNSLGKTSANADNALHNSRGGYAPPSYSAPRPSYSAPMQPRTVVNKTVVNKTIVQQAPAPRPVVAAPRPAAVTPKLPPPSKGYMSQPKRTSIGSVSSKPSSGFSSFRSSSSRRR